MVWIISGLLTIARISAHILALGFLVAVHWSELLPSTRTPTPPGTGFPVYLLTNTESCDEDDEEVGVGVVEEHVDKPGTTNGT